MHAPSLILSVHVMCRVIHFEIICVRVCVKGRVPTEAESAHRELLINVSSHSHECIVAEDCICYFWL